MKKIVINTCFGGFSLSPKAIERWAELKGRKCYWFSTEISKLDENDCYTPVAGTPDNRPFGPSAFDIPNPNEILRRRKPWHKMTDDERRQSSELHRRHSLYSRDIPRDDSALIQVVEELGHEASGKYAELKIVEIPDDIDWGIEEYDGNEHIAEKHQTWS